MCSRLASAPRRIPRQERGQRRVAELLRAASSVIAEVGYEPATMCTIAGRANSSIGSLYQFFPNKESVAEALRAQYVREIEKIWAALAAKAGALSVEELVSTLIRSQIEFADHHPAFLALFEAPPTANTARRRTIIRGRIARVILARNPGMPRSQALRLAEVVREIVRGLLTLYARAGSDKQPAIVEEFKDVLIGYLTGKLEPGTPGAELRERTRFGRRPCGSALSQVPGAQRRI
ncbi:MAG TPA: TetR/AcrR family transcriptional regulator [Terriglobia bacterium]|nr:TetR/AcrR family transcriptional regulator [Terriglobia bacterium]